MGRKPRVLVLTSTFPRWAGDTEPPFVFELTRRLIGRFEVHVLAPHAPGSAAHEQLDGVQVHRFRYAPTKLETLAYQGGILARLRENRARALLLPLFLAAQIIAIRRLLGRYQFDVIHSHWLIPQTLATVLAQTGVRRKVPVVSTCHGADIFGLRGRLLERLKRLLMQNCADVTVVSRAMYDEVVHIAPGTNPAIIPMGTDLETLFTPGHQSDRRPEVVLFVGRLVEKKGVVHLLHAFAIAQRERHGIQLWVAGSGPDEAETRVLAATLGIAESVHFLGPIGHTDLPRLYRQAAVTIIPSVVARGGDQEGFGLVVVEAMACGCPVIVSDLPAVRDIAYGAQVALLVPPGDREQLAVAILRTLNDPNQAASRAGEARKHVVANFGWDTIAANYTAYLTRLSAHPEGRTS